MPTEQDLVKGQDKGLESTADALALDAHGTPSTS